MKSPKAPVPASSGRVLLVVAIGIPAALLGNACDKNKSQSPQELVAAADKIIKQEDVHRALEALYDVYLTGSPEEAEAALLDSGKHIEVLRIGRKDMKFLLHARLHCLEKAIGNDDEAYLHLVKARFWWLAKQIGISTWSSSENAKWLREFTEQRCDRFVIEFDSTNTDKKGARFWQELPGGATSPEDWLAATYGKEQ